MKIENNFQSIPTETGYTEVFIHRYKNGEVFNGKDFAATEVPISLVFNGISHAVMLATPVNLEDFALGFSFSEGIIDHRSQVLELEEIVHPPLGIEMHITTTNACFTRLKERRRSLVGRTGCGLCGIDSLAAFNTGVSAINPNLAGQFTIRQRVLFDAFNQLSQIQTINKVTGSMHAAGWINAQGELMMMREDLGRHNALDKLIGALMQKTTDADKNGCVIMTSRASYELVQKTAKAGIPLLATISAPTSLAIQLAQQSGLTLAGFVRNRNLVIYSHAERLI
ncbi:MAG: sulfurtransferase FdhD [Solimicrobium sp.]|jgi:FdhD protein|nr:sulfurtransferase FdhD [Solimicrobium sp.]